MRFISAVVLLAVAVPAVYAGSNKGVCTSRCDSSYQFCLNRSTTKQSKKSCKADRKVCKKQCK